MSQTYFILAQLRKAVREILIFGNTCALCGDIVEFFSQVVPKGIARVRLGLDWECIAASLIESVSRRDLLTKSKQRFCFWSEESIHTSFTGLLEF